MIPSLLSATAAPNGTVGAERNTPTFNGCHARPEAAALAPSPGGSVCHLLGCQARPKATLAPKRGVHQKAARRARSLFRRPLRHGVRRITPQGLPARTEAAQAPKRGMLWGSQAVAWAERYCACGTRKTPKHHKSQPVIQVFIKKSYVANRIHDDLLDIAN
jgi:hypothetical protein